MKVIVHVREKAIVVPCGEGTQKVKWLGHVGIARYEPPSGTELGVPRLIKSDSGPLDLNATVKDVIQDGAHVWVTTSADELQSAKAPAGGSPSGPATSAAAAATSATATTS